MARTDPRPNMPARCMCRHVSTNHPVNAKGMRAKCTRCGCRLFVKAEAVARG